MPVVYIPLLSAVITIGYESQRLKTWFNAKTNFLFFLFFRHAFDYCIIRISFRTIGIVLGVVHKRCPQSGRREVCPMWTFFGQGRGGSSDADVRTFWWKNLQIFQNLWCVSTTRGKERGLCAPVRTFFEQGEGSIFCNFAKGHLWTTPYN